MRTVFQIADVFSAGMEDRLGAIDDKGTVCIFGGDNADSDQAAFTPNILSWIPGSDPVDTGDDIDVAADGLGLAQLGVAFDSSAGVFVIFGGKYRDAGDDVEAVDLIQTYDFDAGTQATKTSTTTTVRFGVAAAYSSAQGKTYTFGGQTAAANVYGVCYTEIASYIVGTDTFAAIAGQTLNTVTAHAVAVYVPKQDAIYVFGGWDATNGINEIHKFDCATETVSQLTAVCPYLAEGMAAYYNPEDGLIYVFGGAERGPVVYHDDIWTFNPVTHEVTTLDFTLPKAMDDFFGVWRSGGVGYLIGTLPAGADDNQTALQKQNVKVVKGDEMRVRYNKGLIRGLIQWFRTRY